MSEHTHGRDDVALLEKTTAFQGYFRIDRYRVKHRLFRGGWGRPITREVLERGHAVAVLPYDPVRDKVVLIEQFRIAPYAFGDKPWMYEIVAGIIEPDEAPDEVARRELKEEAGLETAAALEPILRYYTTPGASTETCQLYAARVDASAAGGVHGLPDEDEDIRVFALDFAEAMRATTDGRIIASPPLIALQWLALNRDALRRKWA